MAQGNADFLHYFTAGDLVIKNKKVISVSEKTTVEETLDLLKKNNILSAPIVKPDGTITSIVNLWDIVTAICFNQLFEYYDDEKLDKELLSESMFTEALKIDTFKLPVVNVVGLSEESKMLWTFNWDVTIDKLLDPFSKGVHRVLIQGLKPTASSTDATVVITPDMDYRFLSQTDVVRFLYYSQIPELKAILQKDIKSLGLVSHNNNNNNKNNMVYITTKNAALTGFRKLTLHEISAVPVLDEKDGKLVGTVSASDLRGIHQDSFKTTLLPVMEFLQLQHGGQVRAMVTCTANDVLADVMEKVLKNKVHRVWVVDDQQKPVGVVTLSDIICKFSPFDYKQVV